MANRRPAGVPANIMQRAGGQVITAGTKGAASSAATRKPGRTAEPTEPVGSLADLSRNLVSQRERPQKDKIAFGGTAPREVVERFRRASLEVGQSMQQLLIAAMEAMSAEVEREKGRR